MLLIRRFSIAILFFASLAVSEITCAKQYAQYLCKKEGYTCLHVKRNQSWRSLFPDEHDRDIVMRVNRMNTSIWAGMTIAVPDDLAEVDILELSPFPQHITSPQEKVVYVDPANHAWAAYNSDGSLVRWGPVSTGASYCKDVGEACHTRSGSFRVFSLGSSDCISHKFPLPDGGAPMPYCMYFNNGQALHGEPNGLPGYNASHGCVRLYVSDAEWLRYDFVEGPNANNKYRGTKIIVGAYDEPGQGIADELK